MDDIQAARSDLAFLRAIAEDRGALPAPLGWHLVAIGGIFGLDFVHIWAIFAGYAPWPDSLYWGTWLPGMIAYLPANLYINLKSRQESWGPGARVFGAAWAAMATMIPPTLLVMYVAQAETGHPFYMIWPALAFVLYGGAWALVAIIRRRLWHALVALGCFASAALCASLIRDTVQWLVMGAALVAFVGLPGAAIVRHANRSR
jgi:hypothetical protein